MSFLFKKPLLTIGLLLLLLIGLPVTIFLFQQQQETRSRANAAVTLSFAPNSTEAAPVNVPEGAIFPLSIVLNPGTTPVSFVKAEILYDSTKVAVAPTSPFQANTTALGTIVEGPLFEPGKITVTLSSGTDTAKIVSQQATIGTINFRALQSTAISEKNTLVQFGPNTQVLSTSPGTSTSTNVVSNTTPANVYIALNATPTPVPGVNTSFFSWLFPTKTPTPIQSGPTPTPKPNMPTPTTIIGGPTCGNASSDSLLVIDKSGSMNDKNGTTGTKIANAKTAATNFVTIIAGNDQNRLGLATYASTASLNSGLTSDFNSIKSKINALSANGGTCIECGINKANAEMKAHGRPDIKNVVILLTDGLANYIDVNGGKSASTATAEQRALDAAKKGFAEDGTIFYTIGLGNDVNANFLKQIASATGGKYYFSPTGDQLNSIYQEISQVVANGSISGSVFNDANGNGIQDSNEGLLSGWTLQLSTQGNPTPQTFVTDENGTFTFTKLCDGTYTLKEVVQSGWTKTVPTTDGYTISISNGNVVTNKHFGNKKGSRCSDGVDNDNNGVADAADPTCHTDGNPKNPSSYDPNKDGENGGNTCADGKDNNGNNLYDGADPVCHTDKNPNNPGSYDPNLPEESAGTTAISLKVLLDGIGNRGDNTNPTGSDLSNKNPQHPQKETKVEVYNVSNELVATGTGNVVYNSAQGLFEGTIELGNAITTGAYTVKVQTKRYLKRLASGIQTLTTGQTHALPQLALVTGDIDADNKLSILDYNLLLDCYSDLAAAPNCADENKKVASDINDDANVNQIDYNLFLREIATQPGE